MDVLEVEQIAFCKKVKKKKILFRKTQPEMCVKKDQFYLILTC